jgi:hypothetical protein
MVAERAKGVAPLFVGALGGFTVSFRCRALSELLATELFHRGCLCLEFQRLTDLATKIEFLLRYATMLSCLAVQIGIAISPRLPVQIDTLPAGGGELSIGTLNEREWRSSVCPRGRDAIIRGNDVIETVPRFTSPCRGDGNGVSPPIFAAKMSMCQTRRAIFAKPLAINGLRKGQRIVRKVTRVFR